VRDFDSGPGWRKVFNLSAVQLSTKAHCSTSMSGSGEAKVSKSIESISWLHSATVDHDGSHSLLFVHSYHPLTAVIPQLRPTTSFSKVNFGAHNSVVDGRGGMNLRLVKDSDGTNETRPRSQPKPNDKGKEAIRGDSVLSPFGKSSHPKPFNYFQ
jgi:hypothetical protein